MVYVYVINYNKVKTILKMMIIIPDDNNLIKFDSIISEFRDINTSL